MMKTYRIAEEKDFDAVVTLNTDAFQDYDFHKIYCTEDEDRRYAFYRAVFRIVVSLGIERKQILLMEEDGEILAAAQLQAPDEPACTVWDYLTHGVFKALRIGGLKNVLGYMELADVTERECDRIREPHWYLMCFSVSKEREHQGLGSELLSDGVFPYIAEHGGGLLALCTNSQFNEDFYNYNGFTTIKYELLKLNGKEIGNWTLTRRIAAAGHRYRS